MVTKYQATDGAVDSVVRGSESWAYSYTHPSYNVNENKVFAPGGYVDHHVIWLDTDGVVNTEYFGRYKRYANIQRNASLVVTSRSASVLGVDTSTTQFQYDTNKNPTFTILKSTISGEPDIVSELGGYAPSCTNPKTCHRPTWAKDARLNQTDFTWDATHGGLLTVTGPANQSGIRPTTTYTYGQRQAQYYVGSTLVSGDPVWVVTRISRCRTTQTCANTADEVRTEFTYDTANALVVRQIDIRDGTNALLKSVTRTFTPAGDVETEDGPMSGAADSTRFYYDAMRQMTGIIGPDPDGAGAALYGAVRITYDGDGNVVLRESGTATSQAASAMSSFAPIAAVEYVYDSRGDLAQERLKSGSTVYSVTQYTHEYTSTGSYTCVAQRMNPAVFGSLPASACTLGTPGTPGTPGDYGPDRITRTDYDQLGRPLTVTEGLGTAAQAVERTYAYTGQRTVEVTDGQGNKTTSLADGYLRPFKTTFPSITQGAGSSNPADYEQVTLDPNGNVTAFRTRRNETLTMTYDNLNRLTRKTVPERSGLAQTYTRDVFFSYDPAGNPLSACFGNIATPPETVSTECVSNQFDALGQLTTTTTSMDGVSRTLGYQYDAAGNRIRLTYADSNFVYYYRHAGSGQLNYTSRNDTWPLFHPAYDSADRLQVMYGWSSTLADWAFGTVYSYDTVGRVSSFWHALPGSTYDVTWNFGYNPVCKGSAPQPVG
jgi:YD repeat-containing protein